MPLCKAKGALAAAEGAVLVGHPDGGDCDDWHQPHGLLQARPHMPELVTRDAQMSYQVIATRTGVMHAAPCTEDPWGSALKCSDTERCCESSLSPITMHKQGHLDGRSQVLQLAEVVVLQRSWYWVVRRCQEIS